MLMLVMASMGLMGENNNEFDASYLFHNADGDFKELLFSMLPGNTSPPFIFPWENTAGNNVQSSENTAHNNVQSLENTANNTIQSQNNTHDHLQTQFLHSATNLVAPMLPAVSQINHNHLLPRNGRWSEEEHKLFLFGLHEHGKGDWINISKIVQTRTPTQVASHAQKYFLRQASAHKGKRRSVHDIVLPDNRPVPHQIYQQIGVSFPNLNVPLSHHIDQQNGVPFSYPNGAVPHHIDQQNGVPFSYLNGAVPHHIDHQNLVVFPNIDLQHLHGMHPLVPHHINLQNRVAAPNLAMPQLHGMHHSVPHNINQRH